MNTISINHKKIKVRSTMKIKHLLTISLMCISSSAFATQAPYTAEFVTKIPSALNKAVQVFENDIQTIKTRLKDIPAPSGTPLAEHNQRIMNIQSELTITKGNFIEKMRYLTGLVTDPSLRIKGEFHKSIESLFQYCHDSLATAINHNTNPSLSQELSSKLAQINQQLAFFHNVMKIYETDEKNFSTGGAGAMLKKMMLSSFIAPSTIGNYTYPLNENLVFLTFFPSNKDTVQKGVQLLADVDGLLNNASTETSVNYGPISSESLQALQTRIIDDLTPLELLKFMYTHKLKVANDALQKTIDNFEALEGEISPSENTSPTEEAKIEGERFLVIQEEPKSSSESPSPQSEENTTTPSLTPSTASSTSREDADQPLQKGVQTVLLKPRNRSQKQTFATSLAVADAQEAAKTAATKVLNKKK